MTLGLEVLVQEVMAAIKTSPWPISWTSLEMGLSCPFSTRSGVGRLFIISNSVVALVFFPLACGWLTSAAGGGTVSGAWSPPPATVVGGQAPAMAKRLARSASGFA